MSARRALGAVLASVGLGLGGLVMAGPASAAGEASATVPFTDCTFYGFAMTYTPTITVGASRVDATATEVTLTADLDDLPGRSPVAAAGVLEMELALNVDGAPVVLTGSSAVDVPASTPIALPRGFGKVTSSETELDIEVTGVDFVIKGTAFGDIPGGCSEPDTVIGAATVQIGAAPTPPPAPTVTPKPTQTPTKAPTKAPTKTGGGKGTPAKGSPLIKCTLGAPFNSPFDYPAKVTIAGARATAGATKVKLAGTMSNMPGVAPVAIDALPMRLKLETKIDGKPVTLSGEGPITAAANAPIKLPAVSGTATSDAESMKVEVVGLSFEMDELGGLAIGADCTVASGGVLSAMKVGVGKVADPDGDGGSGGGGAGSGTGGSTLPKTGGGDSLPVIGLWAGALALVGGGLLALVPGSPVRRKAGEHS